MPRNLGYHELGFAKVDINRLRRKGFPEVIYSPGKTKQQLIRISQEILKKKQPLLLTHLDQDTYSSLIKKISKLKYSPQAKIAYLRSKNIKNKKGFVAIVTAGTVDIPIAQEAALTLSIMGNKVAKIYDCGVAGVHRIIHKLHILRRARAIIVVAGMEGALASFISGLVSSPIIAVPTSFGYGANFKGLAALLTMLNSCSPGVGVVNIDNGFGAGYLASLINR